MGLFLPSQQPLRQSPKLPALRAVVSAKVRARHLGFLLLRRLRLCSLSEIARKCLSSVLGVPATLPHGGATCAFSLQAGTRPAVPGKPDTAATRGSRWWTGGFLLRQLERFQPFSDAFLLTFRVQLCKLLLVKLLDRELNGQERVQKTPVLFSTILRDALQAFNASREREGAALAAILSKNCDTIEEVVQAVAERIPDIHRNLKEKLEQRLQEALGATLSNASSISPEEVSDRIRQEVTFYALKMDVAEEINRLRTHVAEVRRILKEGGAAGRRLDFVTQEMNREANTLGSKSAAIEMTDAAVALKLCIDQMREQLQNIE